MSAFQIWWRAMPAVIALACAGAAPAAPALTTIQDVLYKADGSRFNGSLIFSWNNFQSGDDNLIPTQGITATVVNGYLKVQLVPTTNASAGASYSVTYMSQGIYQFTETWAVPPSARALRVKDVRTSTGAVVGPAPNPDTSVVAITDVTGLSSELATRPMKGVGFVPARTAVVNSSGQLDGAAGNLSDCVHVDGSSGPCGASSSGESNVVYADGETPGGLVNSVNTVFSLNHTPSPSASLAFYRNGILMKQSADYTLTANTVTFYTASVPQSGDLLTASYRYTSATSSSSTTQYADSETPSGAITGSNQTFTLGTAPAPPASLSFYCNGILMKQGADYVLSGNVVTFYTASVPRPGDLLTAFYRY